MLSQDVSDTLALGLLSLNLALPIPYCLSGAFSTVCLMAMEVPLEERLAHGKALSVLLYTMLIVYDPEVTILKAHEIWLLCVFNPCLFPIKRSGSCPTELLLDNFVLNLPN